MRSSYKNNLKNNKASIIQGCFLSFLVFIFFFGIIHPINIFAMESCQNNFSQQVSISNKKNNSLYFIQTAKAKVLISSKSKILFNTNIILYNNVRGDGCVILSSPKNISVNANGNQINNVLIRGNTKIQLRGHLQIMRSFRVEHGVRIILNNSNLTLYPEINFVNYNQICKNAKGQFIYPSNKSNNLNIPNLNYNTPSTIGLMNFYSSRISFSQINSCSAYYLREIFSLIYIDTELPPPRV